jgi:glucosamine--fructose-6-phosphate aminotransferase (isomerizing)
MQKEIFEQPRAIIDTIGTRVLENEGDVDLNGIELTREQVDGIRRIHLVACGTAHYACMVGKYLLEQIAGVPAEVDLASEFRYRNPILDESCVVIPVSQSGETADTLAALRKGKESGSRVISICNVRDATPRSPVRATTCSTPTPAPRSASRPRKPSPPRSSHSTSWR